MMYPRANWFLCFDDFDINSPKTTPQDEEIYEILTVQNEIQEQSYETTSKLRLW